MAQAEENSFMVIFPRWGLNSDLQDPVPGRYQLSHPCLFLLSVQFLNSKQQECFCNQNLLSSQSFFLQKKNLSHFAMVDIYRMIIQKMDNFLSFSISLKQNRGEIDYSMTWQLFPFFKGVQITRLKSNFCYVDFFQTHVKTSKLVGRTGCIMESEYHTPEI